MAQVRISDLLAASSLAGNEIIEVAQLSTTVTITGTTISALASDNSFNDSANGFVAAGFAVGDRVKVTGFTGDTANNIYAATITALTAGKMTIGGTDGDVIVDDAAGESVTIAKWTSKRVDLSNFSGTGLSETVRDGNTNSNSAFATKGNILEAKDTLQFTGFTALIGATGTYKAVLAFVNSSNVITSIAASTTAASYSAGTARFKFSSLVSIPNGQRFALLVVNTTAPSTTACQVSFITSAGNAGWGYDWIGSSRYASNNPTIGDSIFYTNTDSVTMRVAYKIL